MVFLTCLIVGGVFHLLTHTEAVLTQFFLFQSVFIWTEVIDRTVSIRGQMNVAHMQHQLLLVFSPVV